MFDFYISSGERIDELDVVVLLEDLPEYFLHKGEIGTVLLADIPGKYLVEFSDNEGATTAMPVLDTSQVLKLIGSMAALP